MMFVSYQVSLLAEFHGSPPRYRHFVAFLIHLGNSDWSLAAPGPDCCTDPPALPALCGGDAGEQGRGRGEARGDFLSLTVPAMYRWRFSLVKIVIKSD